MGNQILNSRCLNLNYQIFNMTDFDKAIGTGIGLGVGLVVTGAVLNKFDKFGRLRTRRYVKRKKKRR